jgi:hypothetical protein
MKLNLLYGVSTDVFAWFIFGVFDDIIRDVLLIIRVPSYILSFDEGNFIEFKSSLF